MFRLSMLVVNAIVVIGVNTYIIDSSDIFIYTFYVYYYAN